MKKYFAVFFLLICSLLSSCTKPPAAMVRNVLDLEKKIYPDKIVIITDAGKRYGENFRNTFVDKLVELTQRCHKKVAIMTYGEFVRSPYNNPELRSSFPDSLFVFIQIHSSKSDKWGVFNVKYLMKVKHLDQEPFLVQEISLGAGSWLNDSVQRRGIELANAVFEELDKRNIL